jgi:hypothetical protein
VHTLATTLVSNRTPSLTLPFQNWTHHQAKACFSLLAIFMQSAPKNFLSVEGTMLGNLPFHPQWYGKDRRSIIFPKNIIHQLDIPLSCYRVYQLRYFSNHILSPRCDWLAWTFSLEPWILPDIHLLSIADSPH